MQVVGKPGFGLDNRLVEELTHQASVCQQASQCSVNREGVLAQIKRLVSVVLVVLVAMPPFESKASATWRFQATFTFEVEQKLYDSRGSTNLGGS